MSIAVRTNAVPLAEATTGVHHIAQYWGSESHNVPIGYIQPIKRRWQIDSFEYEDPAALDRFGIDPTNPAGGGIIMSANHFGYPLDGFTTGYTHKLPPSAIPMDKAEQVPRSGLAQAVVGTSDGNDGQPVGPSDDPVNAVNDLVGGGGGTPAWTYGAASGYGGGAPAPAGNPLLNILQMALGASSAAARNSSAFGGAPGGAPPAPTSTAPSAFSTPVGSTSDLSAQETPPVDVGTQPLQESPPQSPGGGALRSKKQKGVRKPKPPPVATA